MDRRRQNRVSKLRTPRVHVGKEPRSSTKANAMKRHLRHRPLNWLLAGMLLLAGLAGSAAQPGAAAPAEAISPLFLGSLANSSTLVQTPADGLFTTLAQQAQSSIDVALYDF